MKLKPPQLVVLSFSTAILIGTLLLSLPISRGGGDGAPLVDILFTATSAVCVTGLTVNDIGTAWSLFGQIVILLLIQIGGLGIMTFSTFFAVMLGRKLTIRENVVIQKALDHHKVQGLPSLIKYILLLTLGIEALGAILLFWRWSVTENWSPITTAYYSTFHSVSAFCNAGFSVFTTNLEKYRGDFYVNFIIMANIFLGGIGFIVLVDLLKGLLFGWKKKYATTRFSLQSKLTIGISVILILAGATVIFALEKDNALNGMPLKEKILASTFQSVTPRTAGFNTLPIDGLRPAVLFFITCLMFIGASPGSTGGGIKTSTVGVLIATWWAMLRNREKVTILKRTIPREVVRRAITIFFVAILWILTATFLLTVFEEDSIGNKDVFVRSLFETASAFGTVGLSTGITANLDIIGKLIIIITMFIGRIGPLTIVLAIPMHEEKTAYSYIEEKVVVG